MKKRRLTAVSDKAAARLFPHERITLAKAAQLAEFEAPYIANATAEALGQEPPRDLTNATVLEKLRADAAAAEPVRRQLSANLDGCEANLKTAETQHKAAVCDYLREAA